MAFTNSRRWSVENMFVHQSIWDVPLIKPRFGCSYDMELSRMGYDVAERISREFESFKLGLKCEKGFRHVHPAELRTKPHKELGVIGALRDMPDLKDLRVSVMYCTFSGSPKLFEMSIQTVIRHFPHALEVVAVVSEEDEELFQGILDRHRASAPFPLRLATDPDKMDGHVQQMYCKVRFKVIDELKTIGLRADLYTHGDHVLHLDSDAVLFEDIEYSHIFHQGKTVLPFRRYRTETPEGLHTSMCWQQGTSFSVGQDLVHEFSVFNTNVYRRSTYPAAREFIEAYHQKSFKDFMSTRRGVCPAAAELAKLTLEARTDMFSDVNFIGAFLWYHMHDDVYWIPTDPWDIQPDQWRPDLSKFAWVCHAEGQHAPADEAGMKQYVADFQMVRSWKQCQMVEAHWKGQTHKGPATREKIDTDSKEWMGAV